MKFPARIMLVCVAAAAACASKIEANTTCYYSKYGDSYVDAVTLPAGICIVMHGANLQLLIRI